MLDLTFGEQVKVVLSRKGMTIKELAELIEERTGMKMSRQNLTQRLSRDNFQEQDMRMIAAILECPLHLSILENGGFVGEIPQKKTEEISKAPVIEEEIYEEPQEEGAYSVDELLAEIDALETESRAARGKEETAEKKEKRTRGLEFPLHWKRQMEPEEIPEEILVQDIFNEDVLVEDVLNDGVLVEDVLQDALDEEEDTELGDVNPYTGREYRTNSVRIHPDRIGYVQVYDRAEHKWTDMTEWAFLGYQERKKALLGKDYEPPIYLD